IREEHMITKFVRSLVLLTVMAVLPATAHAAAITFSFTVRVTELAGNASMLFPTLAIGDTITGQYTFDSATPDEVPANTLFGSYRYTPTPLVPFSTFVDVEGERFAW